MANGDPLWPNERSFSPARAGDFRADACADRGERRDPPKGQTRRTSSGRAPRGGACVQACPVLIDHVDAIGHAPLFDAHRGQRPAEPPPHSRTSRTTTTHGVLAPISVPTGLRLNMRFGGERRRQAVRVPVLGRVCGQLRRKSAEGRSSLRKFSTKPPSRTPSWARRRVHRRSGASHGQRVHVRRSARQNVETLNTQGEEGRDGLPALLQHAQERVPSVRRPLRLSILQLIAELIADERIGLDEDTGSASCS